MWLLGYFVWLFENSECFQHLAMWLLWCSVLFLGCCEVVPGCFGLLLGCSRLLIFLECIQLQRRSVCLLECHSVVVWEFRMFLTCCYAASWVFCVVSRVLLENSFFFACSHLSINCSVTCKSNQYIMNPRVLNHIGNAEMGVYTTWWV